MRSIQIAACDSAPATAPSSKEAARPARSCQAIVDQRRSTTGRCAGTAAARRGLPGVAHTRRNALCSGLDALGGSDHSAAARTSWCQFIQRTTPASPCSAMRLDGS